MLRKLLVGVALLGTGLVAGLTVSVSGQELPGLTAGLSQGAVPSGRSLESFRMPIDVNRKGEPVDDKRLEERRQLLAVPSHYGPLYAITGHGADAVFWYRDEFGSIRNAVVGGAATRLHRIVTRGTDRFEQDYR